jgi:hypothetical protein
MVRTQLKVKTILMIRLLLFDQKAAKRRERRADREF